MPTYTALVTLLSVALYFSTGLMVAKARQKFGVVVPATSGHADFERVFRVQQNMLEWMPIFLPSLWLFAFYVSDVWAAVAGLVWAAGRLVYMVGYSDASERRHAGFFIQLAACAVLWLGALTAIVLRMMHGG
ncbi:MAG TPA: MAPEG family protein [Pseudolabrys sp.]|jgi:glutathione S-transferase